MVDGWLVVGSKADSLSRDISQWVECPPWGLSKRSQPVFKRISEKTTENSERLGRQARPGIEPGTSRLPVFERRTTQPLEGPRTDSLTSMPLVQQLVFPAIAPLGRPYMDRYKICIAVRRAGHKICMCIIGVLLCVSISQLS